MTNQQGVWGIRSAVAAGQYGRTMRPTDTVDAPLDVLPDRVDHLIVGTAFARLCASIKLPEAGEHDALRTLRARGLAAVEPSRAAQESFNTALQRRMRRTVWTTGGCASWYLDDTGRNSTLWPWSTYAYMRRAKFERDDYVLE
jgi:hypothetical protein